MFEIEHYLTPEGRDLYQNWLDALRDIKAKVAVIRRIDRIVLGNFGDHKFCREGVWELRVDVGAGYRVYYGLTGTTVVLLLCAGDKKTQSADIDRACRIWNQKKAAEDADQKTR